VSGQLLLVLKFVLLGLLYLFLFGVVRAVWAEITPSRHGGDASLAATTGRRRSGPAGVPLSDPPLAGHARPAAPAMAPPPHMPQQPVQQSPVAVSALVVLAPEHLAGQQHTLRGESVTVGRGAPSTIVVDDDFVSKVHASFRRKADRWVLEDLGSTNGTTLNGHPVTGPLPVTAGDRVTMGGLTMEIR
jgi:hypothetical protein